MGTPANLSHEELLAIAAGAVRRINWSGFGDVRADAMSDTTLLAVSLGAKSRSYVTVACNRRALAVFNRSARRRKALDKQQDSILAILHQRVPSPFERLCEQEVVRAVDSAVRSVLGVMDEKRRKLLWSAMEHGNVRQTAHKFGVTEAWCRAVKRNFFKAVVKKARKTLELAD